MREKLPTQTMGKIAKLMIITNIEPVEKGKVKICFDNAKPFFLYKGEVKKLALESQMQLDEEEYRRIYYDIVGKRAIKRAMHLLEKKDRTEEELRKKLEQNEYPKELIENAVSYVKSYHYIDDERYARAYVRLNQQKKSSLRLRQELLSRGIAKELIEIALDEENETAPEELIQILLEKKNYDKERASIQEKQKMYRFLMARGFLYEDIMRSL